MSRTIEIGLGERAYQVIVGEGLIGDAGRRLVDLLPAQRTVIVTDETVAALHAPALAKSLRNAGIASTFIILPPGEETKSFAHLEDLCARFAAAGVDRRDVVIALGGGVIGDLAGFAAAIYMRGIGFVQVPTTLLAQVDSSVGGKTAIDTQDAKNLIGAFHQPRRVLADLAVLKTLPAREIRCGYAEILKYGLLGDAAFFDWLEADGAGVLALDPAPLEHAVVCSIAMKAEIVAEDEREAGRRALLNLGHTFAHALEAETGFGGALLHGEAVGIGCAMAFRFSTAQGLCPPANAKRTERAVAAVGLPARLADLDRPLAADALIARMAGDKKAEGGRLTLILARAIGDAFVAKGVEPDMLRRFLIDEGATP